VPGVVRYSLACSVHRTPRRGARTPCADLLGCAYVRWAAVLIS
jgi:hypothetical protein